MLRSIGKIAVLALIALAIFNAQAAAGSLIRTRFGPAPGRVEMSLENGKVISDKS